MIKIYKGQTYENAGGRRHIRRTAAPLGSMRGDRVVPIVASHSNS